MDKLKFDTRVAYNTEILKEALYDNVPLTSILHEVYTWEYEPGEAHFSILIRNAYDIIPSLFLGLLANTDSNGCDAINVDEDNQLTYVEIKTSEVASNKIWKGPQGGLYTGIQNTPARRQALSSGLAASYMLHTQENRDAKNMRTVLMITDTAGENSYIDAYELDGETILEYLSLSNCKSRHIKFGSFQLKGKQSNTVVPLKTFDRFKKTIQHQAPTLQLGDFFAKTTFDIEH